MKKIDHLISSQKNLYEANFLRHGDTPNGTYNQNNTIQNLRFSQIASFIDAESNQFTLHDVGCGVCDFYSYIKKNYSNIIYSGTDIIENMREMALTKHKNIDYKVRNILDAEINEKYDYIILSGVFNLPGEATLKDWEQFVYSMVDKMYAMCNKKVIFNCLSSQATYYNSKMYYVNPEEMMKYCMEKHSRFVNINHAYPLYEFTFSITHPASIREKYQQQELAKYIQ